MTQLTARTRALLDRARQEAEPNATDLGQLRARLGESLAGQTPDPVLLPFWASKLAGVALVAAIGLGGWVLRGALEERGRAPVPPPPPVVVVQAAPAPVEQPVCPPAPACAVPAPPAPRVVACAPVPVAAAAAAEAAAEAEARHRQEQNLFSVAAAQKDPSLELQLLVLARVALDEERALDALGHTLRHEELYPQSAFQEERLAIQVLAYCAAGKHEKAAAHFERLVALAPETGYLPRIRGTCGERFGRGPTP
jgi:tetratricopeptide (TPR) repeat protein